MTVYDNFMGNNGNSPNADKWRGWQGTGDYGYIADGSKVDIQNNMLRIHLKCTYESSPPKEASMGVRSLSKFTFQQTFKFKADWNTIPTAYRGIYNEFILCPTVADDPVRTETDFLWVKIVKSANVVYRYIEVWKRSGGSDTKLASWSFEFDDAMHQYEVIIDETNVTVKQDGTEKCQVAHGLSFTEVFIYFRGQTHHANWDDNYSDDVEASPLPSLLDSSIKQVKIAIIDLLKNDLGIQQILGTDPDGNVPVYHGFEKHRLHKPCITVMDVSENGEVAALNDGFDEEYSYEWYNTVIQIDCWAVDTSAKMGLELRDEISDKIKKAILSGKNTLRANGWIQQISDAVVVLLDEPDAKPPLWRKALRYRVFYIIASS